MAAGCRGRLRSSADPPSPARRPSILRQGHNHHLVQHGAVTVVYDGDGNRVSETVGAVTTKYLVDTLNPTGYAQVVDELVGGSVTRTYAYALERISENQQISS